MFGDPIFNECDSEALLQPDRRFCRSFVRLLGTHHPNVIFGAGLRLATLKRTSRPYYRGFSAERMSILELIDFNPIKNLLVEPMLPLADKVSRVRFLVNTIDKGLTDLCYLNRVV
jgi:hypothetical protein